MGDRLGELEHSAGIALAQHVGTMLVAPRTIVELAGEIRRLRALCVTLLDAYEERATAMAYENPGALRTEDALRAVAFEVGEYRQRIVATD